MLTSTFPVAKFYSRSFFQRRWEGDTLPAAHIVDVIPFPGHDVASIALYDRRTGNLMTGDSLYPGLFSVNQSDMATFTLSTLRLTDIVSDHPVAHWVRTSNKKPRPMLTMAAAPAINRKNMFWSFLADI